MNWLDIQATCPKAMESLGLWVKDRVVSNQQEADVSVDEQGVLTHEGNFNERDLFDFFDSKGIYGSVVFVARPDKQVQFGNEIYIDNRNWRFAGHQKDAAPVFGSRADCEQELFTSCFQLLEQRLSVREGE